MSRNNTVEFNEGWDIVQKGILKLTEILESDLKDEFSVLEYINIYTIVYKMCTQSSPHCYAQQLYDKYRDSLKEYIALTVLPALGKVHHEFMLRELVKFWGNYNVMVRFMSNMFSYLDIYFVSRRSLSSLIEVGVMCFQDLVYNGIQINVKNVVIELINREREGEQIDGALLRNVLNIFIEIGMDFYKNEFEDSMLEDTGAYYSRKAALWISEESCQNYILKAEECFRHERETVAHYLHSSTEQKLLEKVQNEILSRYQTQILGNEYSGCHALLTDEKKDDLSRMYRLFCTIPKGLKQVANIFKQHVTSQGITLFKCVEDAVNNNADRSDIKAIQEHEFVENIIELHDKCMDYVVDAFQGSSVFNKSLREAFEVICDRRVEESTSAELLATFCDNVLKKSGIVKISDDHIESILEKAANLLEYVSDRDLFGEFYRKKLARRLLFHKSANDSHEQTILSKLKHQYGSQLTSKMEVWIRVDCYSIN
jgi:cullin 1